jgi:hypothetical protein
MNGNTTMIILVILNVLTLLFGVVEATAWLISLFASGNAWIVFGVLVLMAVLAAVVVATSPEIDIDIDSNVTFEDRDEE